MWYSELRRDTIQLKFWKDHSGGCVEKWKQGDKLGNYCHNPARVSSGWDQGGSDESVEKWLDFG